MNFRIRLRHSRFELPDGRRVGMSIGGSGVPLVFFHGIGMNRRIYLRLLSRLPQLGFMVVALDAPGHGESFDPAVGAQTFAARVDAARKTLDALGIRRAVFAGHSMGGRTAAHLAAHSPERAVAVVLINPAVGEAFDTSRALFSSPRETAGALWALFRDTAAERTGLGGLGVLFHLKMIVEQYLVNFVHPRRFLSGARAIVEDERSALALELLRSNCIPVALLHGGRDLVIPVESGIEAAQISAATLVTLPEAYHSWVLSTPWTFVEILQQLISEARLGDELRHDLARVRATGGLDEDTLGRYLRADAAAFDLAPAGDVIGSSQPPDRGLYHPFQIASPPAERWEIQRG